MKITFILLFSAFISIQSASSDDIYELIVSINAFPANNDKRDAAIDTLHEIPDAERRIWEYITSQQTNDTEQIPNAYEALSASKLISAFSIDKARDLLVSHSQTNDNFDRLIAEAKAKPDDGFGFGPTSEELQSRQLTIEKLKGSVKIIGENGRSDDLSLIYQFLNWKDDHLVSLASQAAKKLQASSKPNSIEGGANDSSKSIPTVVASTDRIKPERSRLLYGLLLILTFFVIGVFLFKVHKKGV